MLTVVAAVIAREGRLLVCRRRADAPFPLKWEFPGGKVGPGESTIAALARELREELGAEPHVGRELYRTRHRYPELGEEIELILFAAEVPEIPLSRTSFEETRWAFPGELAALDFLDADREFIAELVRGTVQFSDKW